MKNILQILVIFTIVGPYQYNLLNYRQVQEKGDKDAMVYSRERSSSAWITEMFSPEKITIKALM